MASAAESPDDFTQTRRIIEEEAVRILKDKSRLRRFLAAITLFRFLIATIIPLATALVFAVSTQWHVLPWVEATATSDPSCERVSPSDGEIVGGAFRVDDRCSLLAGETVFVVLRDVFPYPDLAEAKPLHWIQCMVKVKEHGDFVCGAFTCVDGAEYEVLPVVPKTQGAQDVYEQWYRKGSDTGKEELPSASDVDIVGENRTIKADHSITPPPAKCSTPDPKPPQTQK